MKIKILFSKEDVRRAHRLYRTLQEITKNIKTSLPRFEVGTYKGKARNPKKTKSKKRKK